MKDLVPEFAIFGGMKGFQLKGSKDGLRNKNLRPLLFGRFRF